MNDRMLQWVGAGVLTVGLSCGLLVGAGAAVAEPEPGSSGDQSTSSQSTDSVAEQSDSGDDAGEDEAVEADVTEDAVVTEEEEAVVEEEDVVEEEVAEEEEDVVDNDAASDTATEEPMPNPAVAIVNEVDEPEQPEETDEPTEATETPEVTVEPLSVVEDAPAAAPEPRTFTELDAEPKSATTQIEVSIPALPTPKSVLTKVINVVGTIAWSVIDFMVKLVIGPPAVPPGSTVTAGRSTLQIDCGDGYTADADWYYPKEGEPDKFIYFQHGFLAHAGVYNLTLAALAERNNAIVVAPTITSNYFACDGCSLTADPMHAAVARLFEGDRAALLASARAAGFEGTLPEQFVITGQSAGSMLAAGAAGYFYDRAPAGDRPDLVGVILYDGSAANGALGRALDKLPSNVPVLHVAAGPSVVNYGGGANKVLTEKRPGQFNGVQLIGGAHSDAFQSSAYFGLVQGFVGLVFGFSSPQNVEAVQVLSQGWLTDMYAGRVYDPATRTGIYGAPGGPGETVVDIPTDAGLARGYVLPGPPASLSPIEWFFARLLHSINSNDFITHSTDTKLHTKHRVIS
ncbi:hypothetical protein [Mycolicibacterium pulveris]|uniref:hypothetical protein n=1 Tax=Mycolicibacterium pulveris TaxID=36813 RepID=UPI003CF415EC